MIGTYSWIRWNENSWFLQRIVSLFFRNAIKVLFSIAHNTLRMWWSRAPDVQFNFVPRYWKIFSTNKLYTSAIAFFSFRIIINIYLLLFRSFQLIGWLKSKNIFCRCLSLVCLHCRTLVMLRLPIQWQFAQTKKTKVWKLTVNIFRSPLEYTNVRPRMSCWNGSSLYMDAEVDSSNIHGKKKKFVPNKMKCLVCLEYFSDNAGLGVLDCGHSFHKKCVQPIYKK